MEEADDEGNETLGFVIDEVINNIGSSWDPTNSVDWEREKVTPQCLTRIKRSVLGGLTGFVYQFSGM